MGRTRRCLPSRLAVLSFLVAEGGRAGCPCFGIFRPWPTYRGHSPVFQETTGHQVLHDAEVDPNVGRGDRANRRQTCASDHTADGDSYNLCSPPRWGTGFPPTFSSHDRQLLAIPLAGL